MKRVRVCFKFQLIEDMWCSLGYAVDDASPPDPNLESAVGKRDFLFATRALTDCGAELRQDSVAMQVMATTPISRNRLTLTELTLTPCLRLDYPSQSW